MQNDITKKNSPKQTQNSKPVILFFIAVHKKQKKKLTFDFISIKIKARSN